jgi:hypothetical protein
MKRFRLLNLLLIVISALAIQGSPKARDRISAISTVRSASIYPLDLGWTRSNSIPRIELGSLRIANWLPKGQDEVFDMDWYILNYVFQK